MHLLFWLVLSSALAYAWPAWVAPHLPSGLQGDPFGPEASGWYLLPLMAVAMFSIGWMLPPDEVDGVLVNWPSVLAGTALQYLSMPLLAAAFATLLGLSPEHRLGLLLVGCVPGAMASNVVTLAARGNTSYSVMLTASATLLSPVAVPLGLWLTLGAGASEAMVFVKAAGILLACVVFPVVTGHIVGRRFPEHRAAAQGIGSAVANVTILVIIATVVASNREAVGGLFRSDFFDAAGIALLVALLGVNLGGYAAGYYGGLALGYSEAMRRALTIEIGMQNAGLGAVLARSLFSETPSAQLPPALFTFGCMFTGTLLATLWSARPPTESTEEPRG